MLKKPYFVAVFTATVLFFAIGYTVAGNADEIEIAHDFLKAYGWETEKRPADTEEVIIPAEFCEVYKSYNKLQNKAQLDLLPYRGMQGRRYTFIVKNYPLDVGETVYANVILIDKKAVAGDIMTVSLNGFMHALNEHF